MKQKSPSRSIVTIRFEIFGKHRLFSQVTRSWRGAPLMSVEQAADRAARTTTKSGLKVEVYIDKNVYQTKRKINHSYEKRVEKQVVFAPRLGKWNYLIKPAEWGNLFFLTLLN